MEFSKYEETLVFNGTPPSNIKQAFYHINVIGKMLSLYINVDFEIMGTGVTMIQVPFPSQVSKPCLRQNVIDGKEEGFESVAVIEPLIPLKLSRVNLKRNHEQEYYMEFSLNKEGITLSGFQLHAMYLIAE